MKGKVGGQCCHKGRKDVDPHGRLRAVQGQMG